MTTTEALRTIQEFVALAVQRRIGSLPEEQRARMERLAERLHDLIDGAKPKARTIENPAAVKNLKIGGLAKDLELALKKKDKKIRDVSTTELPVSFYTPPSSPTFMADYYDEGWLPIATSDLRRGAPKQIISADGSEIQLMDEVKVLFGMAEPPPPPADPVTDGAAARRSSGNRQPQLGRPTIVHYVAGGTKRGEIAPFEPHTGKLIFLEKDGSIDEVDLRSVLAVFFGLLKGEEPTEIAGERLIITLINEKRVTGMTQDYQEGGDSLTLVPDPRRGNIDRIWIPASAVKAIEVG